MDMLKRKIKLEEKLTFLTRSYIHIVSSKGQDL